MKRTISVFFIICGCLITQTQAMDKKQQKEKYFDGKDFRCREIINPSNKMELLSRYFEYVDEYWIIKAKIECLGCTYLRGVCRGDVQRRCQMEEELYQNLCKRKFELEDVLKCRDLDKETCYEISTYESEKIRKELNKSYNDDNNQK